jgi:hypothetical protein
MPMPPAAGAVASRAVSPTTDSEPGATPNAPPAPARPASAAAELVLVGGTADLSDATLRSLLEDIDGMDAMPLVDSAEIPLVEEG